MKYQEWLDNWLTNYIQPTSKPRTCVRYEEIIRQHLIPSLGEYELSELSAYTLQCYIAELLKSGNLKTEEGLSPNSVNSIITIIQNSLKMAYTLDLIPEYFGDKLKRPKALEKQVDCFSMNEQKKIEQAALADKRRKMFGVVLCLYTGLRIGELLALEWSDIDLSAGTVTVNHSCHDGTDQDGKFCRFTDTPKTASSKRVIPIPRQIIPALRERKKNSNSNYVVADENGKPVSVRSYQRSFELLLKKLGIKRKGFHSLRHTFATRALECGMDVKTLSEILGHKNPTVTLNRYVHSMFEHKKDMMNKLGKLFL